MESEPIDDDSNSEPRKVPEPLDPTKRCMFCHELDNVDVDGIDEVMAHMEMSHGFFIPRPERLIALEPLLVLLGKVVGRYHQCCWCWKRFVSLQAVQNHMCDVG